MMMGRRGRALPDARSPSKVGGVLLAALSLTLVTGTAWLVGPVTAAPLSNSTPPTTIVNTLTGFPAPQYPPAPDSRTVPQAPYDVTLEPDSGTDFAALLVSDPINHVVRRIDLRDYRSTSMFSQEVVYAGDGGYGSGPDGVAPIESQLSGAYATATDRSDGSVYVADTFADVVREINIAGAGPTIAGIAGTDGRFGYAGDGGSGLSAQMNTPYGVAVDPGGRVLYVADTLNNVIRAVSLSTSAHSITTAAGTGVAGFNGDGPALHATLNEPRGLAFGSDGYLYIADTGNNRIRRYDPATRTITTLAGDGTPAYRDGAAGAAEFNQPSGLAYDAADGSVLVADTTNDVIRRVSGTANSVVTVAGVANEAGYTGDCPSGTPSCSLATASKLNAPFGVVAAPHGGFFIADTLNYAVRFVDSSSVAAAHIKTVAGNGNKSFNGNGVPETSAELSGVSAISYVSSGVPVPYPAVFADPYNNRIRALDVAGNVVTIAGTGRAGFSGDAGDAAKAELHAPFGVAAFTSGGGLTESIVVADTFNSRIREIDISYALDSGGGISDIQATITTLAGNGNAGWSGDGGPAGLAQLSFPMGVAVAADGSVYVADSYNARIRRIDAAGSTGSVRRISTVAGTGQLAYTASDEGGPATAANLFFPYGVATTGNGASALTIADTFDNRVLSVSGAGSITTIAGTGASGFSGDGRAATAAQLQRPWAISGDSTDGGLLVTDYLNNRVRLICEQSSCHGSAGIVISNGQITSLLGGNVAGDRGDLGPPPAELSAPRDAIIGPSGVLLVADSMSDRIRIQGIAAFSLSGDGDFGYGVPSDCKVPPATADACPTQLFTVTNVGNISVSVMAAITADADRAFGIVPGSNACDMSRLDPGSSCTATLYFRPPSDQAFQAQLNVTDGAPAGTLTSPLSGCGSGCG